MRFTRLEHAIFDLLCPHNEEPSRYMQWVQSSAIAKRLEARYPRLPAEHLHTPWGVLVAFTRRNPGLVRECAADGGLLARQLLAVVQAEDAKALMRRITEGGR